MKKSWILLPIMAVSLCSCVKTAELYPGDAYCHTEFDLNYYTEWNGVDKLAINNTVVKEVTPDISSGLLPANTDYAEANKLTNIEPSFAYGYLSKLYDGRISCEGYYQKSRVQLDKTGYATFFPKQLKDFAATAVQPTFKMALRGGTTYETSLNTYLAVDYEVSFYIHITNSNSYNKVVYKLNNVSTITDKGGDTSVFTFDLNESIKDAVAMSITFKLKDTTHADLTDDYTDKEKEHFAIMLYEILLPDSTWF